MKDLNYQGYQGDNEEEEMKGSSSKKLIKFRIIKSSDDIPSSWRWATVYDVEDSRPSSERVIREHIANEKSDKCDHNYFLIDGEVAVNTDTNEYFAVLHCRISVSSQWKLIVPSESIRKLLERTLLRNHGFTKTDVDGLIDTPSKMIVTEVARHVLSLKTQKFIVAYFICFKSIEKAATLLQSMVPIIINTKESITLALHVILPSPSMSGCSKEQLFVNAIDTLNIVKNSYVPPEISKVYYQEVSSYVYDTKELTRKNIDSFKLAIDSIIIDTIDYDKTPNTRLQLFENFLPVLVTHDKLKVMDALHRFFNTDILLRDYLKQRFSILNLKSWGNNEKINQLLNLYFEACFIGREEFSESHTEMIKILIRTKKCTLQDIRRFIAKINIPSKDKPRLLDNITALLPTSFLCGKGGWSVTSILALFFVALDIGSDFQLTVEYFDWDENLKEYGIGDRSNDHVKCDRISCRVNQLNKQVAFAYSLTILLLMEFFQILYLYRGHSGNIVYSLNIFFLGKNSVSKGSILRRIRRVAFELMSGIFLPFAIGIYEFVLNVQSVQLSVDYVKRKELDIHTTTRCTTCKELRSSEPCVICGYGCTFTEVNGYSEEIKIRQNKASKWNGNVKLLMTTIEDTYMPILQFYFLIPLVMQHMHSGKEFYIGILSGNRLFIYSIYSIVSSILNMASMRSTIYFTRDSKEGLGIPARILFYLSVILTICARILTLETFGLVCLPGRFAPLWLALICLAHCVVVFIMKSFSTYIKMNNRFKLRKGIVRSLLLSSFSSVFTFSKEVTAKKMTPRDYKFSFIDRTCFTVLLFVEQLAMTLFINEYNDYSDVNTILALQILWAILVLGFLLEWIFLVFVNPWAPLRYLYEFKKLILSSLIFVIILISLVTFLYYVQQARIPVISVLLVSLPFIVLVKFRAQMTEKDFNETRYERTVESVCNDEKINEMKPDNAKINRYNDDEFLINDGSEVSDGNYRLTETV